MSARRTERLLNLTIALMGGRRPLSKAELREAIADYRNATSDESFERMFERDKDDLREMGIPLVTESSDPLFDDEIGYRIDPATYALPEIEVGPDEMAVLNLAARAWQQGALAPAASAALRKLEAYSYEDSTLPLAPENLGLEPRLATTEGAFAPLYAAVRDRRPVRFGYRTASAPEVNERHVEPWGVVSWRGRWYLVGHDRDREATRVFRLGRIVGDVRVAGPVGSVDVPDDVDPASALEMVAPDSAPTRTARVRVRADSGHALRAAAIAVTPGPDGTDDLEIPYFDDHGFAPSIVSADGLALEPPELRAACIAHLESLLAPGAAS